MFSAAYCRLSTEDSEDRSIPKQIALCREHARQVGVTIEDRHIFVDEGISGSILERPALMRLMKLVEERQISHLFVSDSDRLSRNTWHAGKLREELREARCKLYISGKLHGDGPDEEMFLTMNDAFAAWERYKIKQRSILGKKRRAGYLEPPGSGRSLGGYMPYGYRYLKNPEGRVVLQDEEAAVVRKIFDLCISGHSIAEIARILTAKLVPTKADHNAKISKKAPRYTWRRQVVERILHNKLYASGTMYFYKTESVRPGRHARYSIRVSRRPPTAHAPMRTGSPSPLNPLSHRTPFSRRRRRSAHASTLPASAATATY
jgi:site-specific DNA recombinase